MISRLFCISYLVTHHGIINAMNEPLNNNSCNNNYRATSSAAECLLNRDKIPVFLLPIFSDLQDLLYEAQHKNFTQVVDSLTWLFTQINRSDYISPAIIATFITDQSFFPYADIKTKGCGNKVLSGIFGLFGCIAGLLASPVVSCMSCDDRRRRRQACHPCIFPAALACSSAMGASAGCRAGSACIPDFDKRLATTLSDLNILLNAHYLFYQPPIIDPTMRDECVVASHIHHLPEADQQAGIAPIMQKLQSTNTVILLQTVTSPATFIKLFNPLKGQISTHAAVMVSIHTNQDAEQGPAALNPTDAEYQFYLDNLTTRTAATLTSEILTYGDAFQITYEQLISLLEANHLGRSEYIQNGYWKHTLKGELIPGVKDCHTHQAYLLRVMHLMTGNAAFSAAITGRIHRSDAPCISSLMAKVLQVPLHEARYDTGAFLR